MIFCTGDAWNLPSEGTGVGRFRLVSPAEETSALALVHFNLLHGAHAWIDTRVLHIDRTTRSLPSPSPHTPTSPPTHPPTHPHHHQKQLSLLRAKIDVLAQQITRLNKTVLYHQENLRENEDALSTKQSEHAQLQVEFRDLTDKSFTPTPSPIQTPPQLDHGCEEEEACDEEGVPDVPMEHTSSGSGAAGDAARPVAGTAKKEAVSWVGGCSQ